MRKPSSLLVLLAFLAACSTAPLQDEDGLAVSPEDITEVTLFDVPPLSALPDTAPRPLKGSYRAVPWADLPGWSADGLDQVWKAFINNCRGLMRPTSGALALPARAAPRVWQPVCRRALDDGLDKDPAAVREFLQGHLRPWRLEGPGGLVTGYYEPLIRASRTRQGDYQWPLYAVPDDLLTIDLGAVYPELAGKRVRGKLQGRRVVPYDTRAQIDAHPDRQPPAIVWADDPIEAFFLQIQGSGRVRLPDGSTIRLAYADHNGRPYASIGQWLAQQGEMPLAQASMQNIKAWARRHPERLGELLSVNPAMVFFRAETIVDPELGPRGAYGVPLIGQRAVAVDADYVPLGTPLFLATQQPGGTGPLQRLVFAQDTGAAIQGPARVDFYWGTGDEAGARAGRMKQKGHVWLLWPVSAGAPTAR
ncbi:murein transglycosylase A [Castellaniella sp.]|uniref:murein transglycosylase A n=1 Tax=Castellaniella sp. TaxID=1955812 RepID=UPI0035620AA1